MCSASTIPGGSMGLGVIINNLLPALLGDRDTHNGLGPLQLGGIDPKVLIGGIPAIPAIASMAQTDVMGIIPHITGFPIPMQGSQNVFIGSGSMGAGIGMMQQLLGGGFGGLQIGELVSMAGQVVGMVQNFTSIGGGAAVAQITNMPNQGTPVPQPGSILVGQTTGYNFLLQNYVDSRTYSGANSYPSIDTVSSNALVTDSVNGDYIVIEDYHTYTYTNPNTSEVVPTMNLTASVITT